LELLIPTIQIVDISILRELLISVIRNADINNSN